MLARTVRNLERDGLVSRTVFAQVPPKVEYELTASGRTLIEPAIALAEWAIDHNPEIEEHQAVYDASSDQSAASPTRLKPRHFAACRRHFGPHPHTEVRRLVT